MIIIDLDRVGRGRRIRRNPYASSREVNWELARYGLSGAISGSNKKTSGSSSHALGSNLKIEKSQVHRGVSYITKGLALTSANFIAQWVRSPELQARAKLTPAQLGLTAAEVDQIKRSKTVCPGATAGCMAVCLVDAGQQGTPTAKQAQIKRILAFQLKRDALMSSVSREIVNLIKAVQRKRRSERGNIYPAVRLNINSDVDWENITFHVDPWLAKQVQAVSDGTVKAGTQSIIDLFRHSEVIFYDYTKRADRFLKYATDPNWPSNYFLTLSLSEAPSNRKAALDYLHALQSGERVRPAQIAVPFAFYNREGKRYIRLPGKKGVQWKLPETLTIVDERSGLKATTPIIDGDPSDARFDDAQAFPGSIAGLRFKEVLARSTKGTIESYNRSFIEPAVKRGFILKAHEGKPHIVIGVNSGGDQLDLTNSQVKAG